MLRDEQAQVNPDLLLPNAHSDLTQNPHKNGEAGWMDGRTKNLQDGEGEVHCASEARCSCTRTSSSATSLLIRMLQ